MSWAIQQRRLSLAEDFIEAGMDVSVEPEPFATVSPLYAAIKGRFLGLNKQLISKGATHCWHKVDGAINKTTPLHASMYSGDIEMVNFFLDEGREINEGDDVRHDVWNYAASAHSLLVGWSYTTPQSR
eukprot:TRINITY_DN11261_c0_g1_i1.p3 TRINITY_DN11261_c0_g1~~TRINITY_DN11261_c0_g1_i1.p3  ORF type:complete len:128 (+),score=18.00 TRINITY_DN11261_c0_g1_i1:559-942(+)